MAPTGMIRIPTHFTSWLMERTISDCSPLPMALAWAVSLEI